MTRFIPQYEPVVKPEYIEAVTKQMQSGWVGCGERVEEFEREVQKRCKAKHVISTTSGTMALYLALHSLNVPKDKKIIFPAYTFLAGANVAKHLGYDIHFMDVDRDTMSLDPWVVESFLRHNHENIGAVIHVDHNSLTYPAHDIKRSCKDYGVPLIEDSAQAIGFGGFDGDIGIFSFSVPKLITTGQGGVAFTDNDELAARMRQLRDHGDDWRKTKTHNHIGLNLKFNDILAAYGIAQLKEFDTLVSTREEILQEYKKHLTWLKHGWWGPKMLAWMVIYHTDKADEIITALGSQNIQAVKYYRSIPSNPAFGVTERFPNAEYIHDHYLYLPSSLNLSKKDIKRICSIILEVENE